MSYLMGVIKYPFALEPGISTQNIAFDVLAREGFDSSIIATARSVLFSYSQPLR